MSTFPASEDAFPLINREDAAIDKVESLLAPVVAELGIPVDTAGGLATHAAVTAEASARSITETHLANEIATLQSQVATLVTTAGGGGRSGGTTPVVAAPPTTTPTTPTPTPTTGSGSAGTGSSSTPAPTPVVAGLPSVPSGPPKPSAGFRLLLADDFAGTALWNAVWTPTAQYPGAPAIAGPYNPWEVANLLSANVSIDGHSNLKMINNAVTTTANDGKTRYYGGCAVGTAGGFMPNTGGFRWSPAFGGPLFFEFRAKITGSAPGSNGCEYPGLWATSVRQWGRTPAEGDNTAWTAEHDWFEWAGGFQPPLPDSNVLVPSNGYGRGGNMLQGYGAHAVGLPNVPVPGIADLSQAFHVYTIRVNVDGSFDTYVDGKYFRTCGVANLSTNGAPSVDQYGNPHSYPSFSVCYDYMAIQIQCDMDRPAGSGWTGDEMLIDYVMAWQDASVPVGQGLAGPSSLMNGEALIAPGTVVGTGGSFSGGGGGAVAPAPLVPYATAVAALASPVLELALDEASGLVAADHGPNAWAGAYPSAGVTYGVVNPAAGPETDNKVVTLGPAATINVPNHPALELSTTSATLWTVLMQVEVPTSNTGPAANPGYPAILSLGNGTTTGFELFYSTANQSVGVQIGGASSAMPIPVALSAGIATLGVTWDGTALSYYLGGAFAGSDPTTVGKSVTDTTSPLLIGPGITVGQIKITAAALSAAGHATFAAAYQG